MSSLNHMPATLDLFRLDGKIALVTGGAGILGRPIARALSEAGATVVIAARDTERCETLAAALRADGLSVEAVYLDLSSEDSISACRSKILSRHGKLDVLINNAVARTGGDLRATSAQDWEQAMKVNSLGLFLACQIFSESMQAQCSGSIINVSSIYGLVGPTLSIYEGTPLMNPVNYAFAKGGVINFTRYLASYLAASHIRVNCLSPGGVRTEDTPATFVENYSARVPFGRMAEPDEIRGPIVFLASDASSYLTGQNIVVDGGWTAI